MHSWNEGARTAYTNITRRYEIKKKCNQKNKGTLNIYRREMKIDRKHESINELKKKKKQIARKIINIKVKEKTRQSDEPFPEMVILHSGGTFSSIEITTFFFFYLILF